MTPERIREIVFQVWCAADDGATVKEMCERSVRLAVNEALHEADNIILLLTADHNSGPHYVKGFELAQEYMRERNNDIR